MTDSTAQITSTAIDIAPNLVDRNAVISSMIDIRAKKLESFRKIVTELFYDREKIETKIKDSIQSKSNSFRIAYIFPISNQLDVDVAKQVLRELNNALKGNTVLRRVEFGSHCSDIQVYFNDPTRYSLLSISGKALTAFSVAAAGAKDWVLKQFRQSPAKIEKYNSAFADNFQVAAQGVISAVEYFKKAAEGKGFKFDVDVERMATLSSRYLELAQHRQEETIRVPLQEQMRIDPIKDLSKAMNEMSKYHTLNQDDVSQIETTAQILIDSLERKVSSIESSRTMRDAVRVSLDVASMQLAR